MDPEYSYELGYYDSNEGYASDFVDSSEEEDFYKHVPIINNLNTMNLPIDIMEEILYRSTIPTYIKLCNSSKEFKKLCTNNLWQKKFNQYNIDVDKTPIYFDDCVLLYKKHLEKLALYRITDEFIEGFEYTSYIKLNEILIKLNKIIDLNTLLSLMSIQNETQWNNNFETLSIKYKKHVIYTVEYSYVLDPDKLREFIYNLFYYGYLDKYNKYFYNDYGWYVTENDLYYHSSLYVTT